MNYIEILALLVGIFVVARVVLALRRGDKITIGPAGRSQDDIDWQHRQSLHHNVPDLSPGNDNRGPD